MLSEHHIDANPSSMKDTGDRKRDSQVMKGSIKDQLLDTNLHHQSEGNYEALIPPSNLFIAIISIHLYYKLK